MQNQLNSKLNRYHFASVCLTDVQHNLANNIMNDIVSTVPMAISSCSVMLRAIQYHEIIHNVIAMLSNV